MGFFSDIDIQISEWLGRGRTPAETFIYFKDYTTYERVLDIAQGYYDTDPQPQE